MSGRRSRHLRKVALRTPGMGLRQYRFLKRWWAGLSQPERRKLQG